MTCMNLTSLFIKEIIQQKQGSLLKVHGNIAEILDKWFKAALISVSSRKRQKWIIYYLCYADETQVDMAVNQE